MHVKLLGLAALLIPAAVSAQVYVQGYTRSDGTYVPPHYRSSPDSTRYNNYSTVGNVNPYTGAPGTKSPYGSSNTSNYGSYQSPYTSPRSGTSTTRTCTYFSPC